MLRLERLELSGFKSFVDPAGLGFPGGITCVVGPNGCGKSNLADAISWVLGEQSAKILRGDRMEDVIFNGAERRKPLGMAEVAMVLATDPSFPAADDGRLTVSRRVFRSGESQYRLNGKLVRLKDVKDLLMDTGLGIRAYSVIEQGRVGMILSGKPQERRKLLEEAAGVTRYKTRKRIAEVKLEEANGNLVRLDDVIGEVERSLRSLKRQASAARRYVEREAEYRELLERVLTGRWSVLSARLATVATELDAAGDEEAAGAAALARQEAELAAGRELLDELSAALAERHERQASLAARIEGRQERLKGARANLVEVTERATAAGRRGDEKASEIVGLTEALEALGGRRGELAEELARAEDAAGEGSRQLAGSEGRVARARELIEQRRQELLAVIAEINALRNRLHQEQLELERGATRRQYLDEEVERLRHEVGQAEEQVEMARAAVAALEGRLDEQSAELSGVETALATVMAEEAAASERRRELAERLSRARQRRQLLAGLAETHAEARQALTEALGAAGVPSPVFLSERLAATAGWERSLDFYLGALADAVVIPGAEEALALARRLAGRSAGAGKAALLTAVEPSPRRELSDPAAALALGEALGLPPEVAAALPPAYLVDDAAAAQRLARRHPGVAFLSPDGVWAEGGLLHVAGGEALPGLLERQRELVDLEAETPRIEQALGAAVAAVEALVAERSQRAGEAHRVEGAITELRQEIAVGQARLQGAEERHARLERDLAAASEEHAEVAGGLERLGERRESLDAERAAAEARHAELTAAFDAAEAEVEAAKGAREELRAERAGHEGHLALLRERLAAHDRERARLEREIEEGRRQVAAWRQEVERLAGRRSELESEIATTEEELQGLLEERASSEEEVLAAQARVDDQRAVLKELAAVLTASRERHGAARARAEELRIARATLDQDAGHLAATFRERFDREPPETPPPPADDLAELEADLARRKEILDRMGPVNALAVEEYAEQEERYEFLTVQRADVAASVESLRKTIREINQTSSARFRETFAEVNQSFGEVFERLFRGGEAQMRLLDEDDPLESGIEIVARPPGKRLQNIMLLSGGEKALTAIALLFALFRYKPSPFCVLDEVDAPLDDANALRFVQLLEEMSTDTQFVVITHNKITMQVARTLYGVTMEERGVSKLVSVELDEIHPEQRATA